jgi:hypothetical protein
VLHDDVGVPSIHGVAVDGGDVGVVEVSGELYLLQGAPLELVRLSQRHGLEDDEKPPCLLGVLARSR